MILPLATVPYISRVLNPEGVGTYAYTNSIVQYFILFGMLGIGIYGNTMVAKVRDNKQKLSKTFFSIYILQLVLTCISLISYFVLVILFFHEYKLIALLQAIALMASIFNCSWLFAGLEQFKKIVTRDILVKVISLIAVFTFVKTSDDLALYTIIMGASTLLGNIVMWLYVREYIVPVKINFSDVVGHLKPTIVYFLPQIALQVYFVLDKTMLGLISGSREVGYYDYANRILSIAVAIVTSLGTVMLPRMANTFARGDLEKVNYYIYKSIQFSTLLAIPITFGLAGIANEFIPWFLGKDFSRSTLILMIISPAIILKALSGVFGTQFLVPIGRMKEFTISLYAGAIVNLIINFILIKPYGAVGAAIGTICAELAVTLVMIFFIRKQINIIKVLPNLIYYFIAGIIMFVLLRTIGNFLGVSIMTTIIQIILGAIVYFIIIIIFEMLTKDKLVLNEMKKMLGK